MAPVLQVLPAEPRAFSSRELREAVAAQVGLTAGDRQETLPSGQPRFANRVGWAVTYLVKAGLVVRPRRGYVQITERGSQTLRDHPTGIDNSVLRSFDEFVEFTGRGGDKTPPPSPAPTPDASREELSPQEALQAAVAAADETVAAELLQRLYEAEPTFLERVVLRLLEAMGYGGAAGSAERLGRSGDEGVDGVIRQDSLGLDRIYVQAKRYAGHRAVGRPDIQGFVGALHGQQADRGVFITTARFSAEARDYAERVQQRLVLIDGPRLGRLMIQYGVGVQTVETYVLRRVDEDLFSED